MLPGRETVSVCRQIQSVVSRIQWGSWDVPPVDKRGPPCARAWGGIFKQSMLGTRDRHRVSKCY